ncbi:ribonuclease R [Acuticoccus sp. MNP-M23]|uniref:ribonuclease R n=1 Tax=Acuticoccus sp. MNP-M23 TaxID=3072793 RepID=UPI0028159020|nr:ribonuclease R [Acuticoccus sp. MNP-M23]WMS42732.1 ribonuclease R [Acuticoccus sp. MNP-M23]
MNKEHFPSREEILRFVAESPGRVGKREIARAFNIKGGDRILLKHLLAEMAEDGVLTKDGKHIQKTGELPRVALLQVVAKSADGDLVAEPTSWDGDGPRPKVILIGKGPAPGMGDRLLARIQYAEDGRPLGKVVKVIERRPAQTLAVLERIGGKPQLTPVTKKERDIWSVDAAAVKDIADNTLVRIEPARGHFAKIVEVVGPVGSEQAVSLLAIHAHGIPDRFPERVLEEAAAAEPATLKGREDWRDIPFVTIDPADAKDHDDAVFAEPDPHNEGGHIVTVAIADVAAYVTPGSLMDVEARLRGNSTYFPDRVVPMLPERISNDLCSLREGEARPAMAIRIWFARDGRQSKHTLHRVLMRSARKLAYAEAQAIADGAPSDIAPQVNALYEAYACARRGREHRQPMELDLPERKIALTPDGDVARVIVPERLDAHKLIEEFMIQANVAAAELCESVRLPLLYRVHDAPSLDKIDALREFLSTIDIKLAKGTRLRPEHFNAILAQVEGTPNAQLVNEVVLRSQSQAEYSPDNLGHFGLNLRRYAHFTSPIRRYADLIVHRALIRAHDLGKDGLRDHEVDALAQIGSEISATERRSMIAERETTDRLIAGWLAESIGATFDGRIAGVTKSGLFIKLADTGGDGFIPISTLGSEYMIYEEASHALVGEASGHTYRLGDTVNVRLLEAAPFSGALRFEIVDHDAGPSIRRARGARPAQGRRKPPSRKGRR